MSPDRVISLCRRSEATAARCREEGVWEDILLSMGIALTTSAHDDDAENIVALLTTRDPYEALSLLSSFSYPIVVPSPSLLRRYKMVNPGSPYPPLSSDYDATAMWLMLLPKVATLPQLMLWLRTQQQTYTPAVRKAMKMIASAQNGTYSEAEELPLLQ